MGNQLSFEVEIKSKKGTPEYEEEIFSELGKVMKSFSKGLLKNPTVSYGIMRSRGFSFKVVKKTILHKKGYYALHTLSYEKTRERAEQKLLKILRKKESGIDGNV